MKLKAGFILTLLCVCSKFKHIIAYADKHPVVYTKYGPVVGLTQLSRNVREFLSFRGIPYAQAPVGDLRFKAPEPPKPWSFAINATKDASYCIQKNYFFSNPRVEGSEDCLFINVYVPKVMDNTGNQLLPVMVFTHWGGFFAGRGSSDIIGPEYFMDRDIVLVSFNYRLGVFGFLSTLDDAAPGNFGLKDQVMALKFVQENIESFGGDKNRVTLFGQSAGSGSVSLHLLSPLSKGLFQQAITQSGVALDLWAKPLNNLQVNVTAALALFTGCIQHLNNSVNLVNCLRKVDSLELAETADRFKYFSIEPLTPYSVVTETKSSANPHPFLTMEPVEYLQSGEFMKIPWIVGSTQDEGILRVAPLTRQPETFAAFNGNFTTLLPQMMYLELSVGSNTSLLFEDILKFYLRGERLINLDDPKSIQGLINLYSDRSFNYGIYQAVILQSQKGHQPIWMYNFNYKGQYTYGDQFAATPNEISFNWGVSHCDDLLYLFRSPALFPDLTDKTDIQMSETLLTLWTNFAIYGDPDPLQVVKWKCLNFTTADDIRNANLNVFHITGNCSNKTIEHKMLNGFYPDRMRFWANQKLAENFPGVN